MNYIKKTDDGNYEINGKPVTSTDYKYKLTAEEIHFFELFLKAVEQDKRKIQSSIY